MRLAADSFKLFALATRADQALVIGVGDVEPVSQRLPAALESGVAHGVGHGFVQLVLLTLAHPGVALDVLTEAVAHRLEPFVGHFARVQLAPELLEKRVLRLDRRLTDLV